MVSSRGHQELTDIADWPPALPPTGAARQTVELLLSLDPPVEVHTLDGDGNTAMHHACQGGDVRILEVRPLGTDQSPGQAARDSCLCVES